VNPRVFSFLLLAVLALVLATHGEAGRPEKPKANKDYAVIVGTVPLPTMSAILRMFPLA
jgi:hypothetical protein